MMLRDSIMSGVMTRLLTKKAHIHTAATNTTSHGPETFMPFICSVCSIVYYFR